MTTITIKPDGEGYRLYVNSPLSGTLPAGGRLLKGGAPNVEFLHLNMKDAERDAAKLQEHINQWDDSKMIKKSQRDGKKYG